MIRTRLKYRETAARCSKSDVSILVESKEKVSRSPEDAVFHLISARSEGTKKEREGEGERLRSKNSGFPFSPAPSSVFTTQSPLLCPPIANGEDHPANRIFVGAAAVSDFFHID